FDSTSPLPSRKLGGSSPELTTKGSPRLLGSTERVALPEVFVFLAVRRRALAWHRGVAHKQGIWVAPNPNLDRVHPPQLLTTVGADEILGAKTKTVVLGSTARAPIEACVEPNTLPRHLRASVAADGTGGRTQRRPYGRVLTFFLILCWS